MPKLRISKTKIWVTLISLLLVFYLVVMVQRSFTLMFVSPEWQAKLMGAAYFLIPFVAAWALISEVLFGARTEKLARILESEGGLPEDNLPRTPGGRIVRAAADAEFEKYKDEAEMAPGDWRSWFRLSCAYDASGDRKRARKAMRDAVAMYRAG
ncbi:hypothetical protein QO003_003914 [Arthrobacter silviterrae]|uniref:Tetratricopeptide repeat protein n=1 Tax=Arthrobacter silviterrae TaxID=2026658 RepID=A0ABX0D507_9MICC|nr:hypothetical protein [Arthrobacter silviterrae]MDQ0279611.1 hypothetical protein [Arthrobacter silviterrae]NGN81912.1 hypothetical protein [Arthrobacter silviterrae]